MAKHSAENWRVETWFSYVIEGRDQSRPMNPSSLNLEMSF
jgi:hypothetical protein